MTEFHLAAKAKTGCGNAREDSLRAEKVKKTIRPVIMSLHKGYQHAKNQNS